MIAVGKYLTHDSKPWEMEGKSGVVHTLYLAPEHVQDAADRIRITAEDAAYLAAEAHPGYWVRVPVAIALQQGNGSRARLQITATGAVQIPVDQSGI